MSDVTTTTETYSTVDIENVMRNFSADLRMIAESSGTWSRDQVEKYVYDITLMAKEDYLKFVDVTLFNGAEEVCAERYTINEKAGNLTNSRPGGVLWPRMSSGSLRIVIGYTSKWVSSPLDSKRLKNEWSATNADINHGTLKSTVGRDFVSNSYGLERKDYAK